MRDNIYSASYGRAENGVAVIHELIPDVRYVVCESEEEAYLKIHDRVITVPDSDFGKIEKNNHVLDLNPGGEVVLMDDDITSIGVWESNNRRKLNRDEIVDFIDHGFLLCREWGLKMWGVNCVEDKGSYREYSPFSTKAFVGGPFHAMIECGLRYDPAMSSKDDYDMNLQMMNEFRGALRFNMYFLECDMAGKPGGYSEGRTVKRELKLNQALRKKWGSEIIREDKKARSHAKKEKVFDINPVLRVPIKGV